MRSSPAASATPSRTLAAAAGEDDDGCRDDAIAQVFAVAQVWESSKDAVCAV